MPAAAATPAETSTRLKRSARRLAEREQLQGEEHCEGDDRGDVQAADRQQVREPAAAHRVGVVGVHRILVAGRERDGDAGRARREAATRCACEGRSALGRGRGAAAGRDHRHRPHRLADRAQSPEPGVAREIVGAGKRHRRRRREPGLDPDLGARGDPCGKLVLVDRDPHVRRKRRIAGRKGQPHRIPGRKIVDCHRPCRRRP